MLQSSVKNRKQWHALRQQKLYPSKDSIHPNYQRTSQICFLLCTIIISAEYTMFSIQHWGGVGQISKGGKVTPFTEIKKQSFSQTLLRKSREIVLSQDKMKLSQHYKSNEHIKPGAMSKIDKAKRKQMATTQAQEEQQLYAKSLFLPNKVYDPEFLEQVDDQMTKILTMANSQQLNATINSFKPAFEPQQFEPEHQQDPAPPSLDRKEKGGTGVSPITFFRKDIFKIYSKNYDPARLVYIAAKNEPKIFEQFFNVIKSELSYIISMQNRKTKLAKMRTTIIRRTLDEFVAMQVSSSSQKLNHIENYNRRLTHEDRERYKRARMPCPPCRIKSNYLEEIFSNKEFCKFFLHFVRNDKLYLYLTRTNKALVNEFKEKLIAMARENAPVGVVAIEMEAATRKPLFVREIIEYINESRRIAQEYCQSEDYNSHTQEVNLEYESDPEEK